MKAAFPYMGNIRVPLKAILENLGATPIIPPPPDADVLAQGARLAPELVCIPCKVTLGNFIRALDLGADTLVYTGGSWSCRYGYYSRVHETVLRDLGYRFRVVVLRHDSIGASLREIVRLSDGRFTRALTRAARAGRMGWLKSSAVDLLERTSRWTRPVESEPGTSTRLFQQYLARIDAAQSGSALTRIRADVKQAFQAVRTVPGRQPLRVRVVGESFCLIEPFVNLNLFERLGGMGVWVDPFLTTHRWLGFHGFRLYDRERRRLLRQARRYWRYNVGGEDENSVAHMLQAAEQGFDGIIHLHPFGCMPGTVVGPVLHQIGREYDLPLLDISLDEQTAEAGLYTRVEAFVSVLEKRRKRRPAQTPAACLSRPPETNLV